MRTVLINGQVVDPGRASIPVYDRGFLYGDSVFETIRTYGGAPYALDEHMQRLRRSAERVLITLPVPLATISDEVNEGIGLAANPESYVRVMVTRGTGPMGLDPDLAESPNRVVFVEPLVAPPREHYRDGIGVILSRTARTADATGAAGAKVANYLTSLLALRDAKRAGAAEALFVDGKGRVIEGASSNVFIARRGGLVTPPEASGILPGITRAHLIEAAARLGIGVATSDITEADLFAADEAFISSSIREVLPVVRVDGRPIGSGVPGKVTRRIHEEFRAAAGVSGPLPWE
jgi:branched-chain amino acid aminotransferase